MKDPDISRIILSIGRKVDAAWKKERYHPAVFSSVAGRFLRKNALHRVLTLRQTVRWLNAVREFPTQFSQEKYFGEPPVTLYRDGRFLIEIYFWISPETTIHSHPFSGAFYVLSGKSLHCRYDFSVRENYENDILIGELTVKEIELLRRGDVREFSSRKDFIHYVSHLSFPSVSLVIRTLLEPGHHYAYLFPRFAYKDRLPLPEREVKRVELMRFLHRSRHPLKRKILFDLLRGLKPVDRVLCLLQYAAATSDLEGIRELSAKFTKKDGRWLLHFLEALKAWRETSVAWERLTDEEERLFFSLLGAVPDRGRIDRFLEKLYPEKSPADFMLRQLKQALSKQALPLTLNETGYDILRLLIHGKSDREACRHFPQRHRKEIRRFCRLLRGQSLLKPLFTNSLTNPTARLSGTKASS